MVQVNINKFKEYYKNKTCAVSFSCNFYGEMSIESLKQEYNKTAIDVMEFKIDKNKVL